MKRFQMHSFICHILQNKKVIFYLCCNIILIKQMANPIQNTLDAHIMKTIEVTKRMLIMVK